MKKGSRKVQGLVKVALIAAMLTITGAVKLPSLFPGAEFQFSAPLAVAVCAVYGFRDYFIAGALSSMIGFIMGTQNMMHILVACIFRLVAGAVVIGCRKADFAVVIAGPVATLAARLFLSLLIGKAAYPLILAALPGMVYTAVGAVFFTKMLQKVHRR